MSHLKTELVPGIYFSPGFYQRFWQSSIIGQFDGKTVLSHVKLKPYREVWIGSILAASQTKITGNEHYVGLPPTEPPDVEIIARVPTKTPSGKPATNLNRMPVEITRSDLDQGETILGQIKRKNTDAYKGMVLVVYAYGGDNPTDFEAIRKELNTWNVKPASILEIGSVHRSEHGIIIPNGTFSVTRLYPSKSQNLVNLSDQKAFHYKPEMIRQEKRGVNPDLYEMGLLELMPPKLK